MDNTGTGVFTRQARISIIAGLAALCLLLLTTIGVFAGTVNISDPVGVLNASQVRSAGSSLPYPVNIYTTNTFNGTSSSFNQQTASHISASNLIVMAIDVRNRHLAIVGGKSVPLSNSQYNDAIQSFVNDYRSNQNYTSATVAALNTLNNDLGASSGGGFLPSTGRSGFNPGSGWICCIGLLVIAGVLFFVFRNRRRGMGMGRPAMPLNQPYNQPYGPYNQGPYNQGPYNQGQGGMNPWAAGGLGAAAGGLLGYELGKNQGEQEGRNEGGNFGGGNDFGGGASGDFGGGGGDFGGGASGDFGGGGGGDFGGGGGNDFGGGGSGNF